MSMIAGMILIATCYLVVGCIGLLCCSTHKYDNPFIILVFWPLIFIKWLLINMFKIVFTDWRE